MRLPALALGRLELRRFGRARLTRIAVAALVLLPLLYAGLYLWSFWDPYAKLQHVPVALVVADRPATAGGQTVHAGADLADELERRKVFDWHTVSEATAEKGVRSGRYYMALTIPADFSARIAAPSGDGALSPASLRLQLNDANNYVVGSIAEAAFKEVSAAAGTKAVRGYFDQIFISFGKLHTKLQEAADGADKLADGNGRAEEGAGRLHNGLDQAHSGGRQLTSGLDTLHDGTRRLADGGRQAAAGMHRLTSAVDRAGDIAVPLLRTNAPRIRAAALQVARGADALSASAERLPALTAGAVRQAEAAQADLDRYLAAHPEVPAPVRQKLGAAARQLVAVAREVNGYVRSHTGQLRKVAADARAVGRLARLIAANAPTLADRIDRARRDVDRLDAGVTRLAAGAAQVDRGTGQALTGADRLTSGLGTLSGGAGTLESALAQLASGSGELAGGLRDGVGQVPSYSGQERDQRAGVMSQPVKLVAQKENEAPNYGTGFAPFFVPLSLWVGAMVIYMLLRPLNPRALAGTAPAWRVALAGWLPALTIGTLQALVVLSVLRVALGLEVKHWPALIVFLVLATGTFLAVVQWVNARFGPAGRIVALLLLMLQLTSAAGTYPIETSPRFFQVIQPFLPMPWAVRALRHLISGGDLTSVWQATAVLATFLVASLALTSLAATQNRTWTPKRLHPVLKL